ncbi:MAG: hypothetical protein CMP68_01995 [Flavobacteriales bacterium]|nr:hypothetical protein [Flavobacteriales bacterium]|tara:strand:- start:45389 stop:46693 length:1305 start_codon:yes stop_codon:yes gene_type:complete
MKKIKIYTILLLFTSISFSQINTNSPYSFYGVGQIYPIGFSQNFSMSGLSNAVIDNHHLNFQNPASLSFLTITSVELGFNLSQINMQQGGLNKSNTFSNILGFGMGFPISQKTSLAISFRPFSSIGYEIEYAEPQINDKINSGDLTYNFSGNGGLNKATISGSHKFSLNSNFTISAGLNLNYFFGTISKVNLIEFQSDDFVNYRENTSSYIRDFQLNYGLIIDRKINNKNIALGLIYSPQTNLASSQDIFANTYTLLGSSESLRDTIKDVNEQNGYMQFPNFINAGLNIYNANTWLLGIDYNFTNWKNYKLFNSSFSYIENLNEFIIGGYFVPKFDDIHNYWNRVQYRFGVSYSTGYLNLSSIQNIDSGNELLRDLKFSIGFGMPIPKNISQLNFGIQFGKRGSSDSSLVDEKYINFIFSMTFNDKWFKKRKIE